MRRNKTERRRLQGLQKTLPRIRGPAEPKSLKERLNVWLINEGGRKLFFATWILLHLLVAVFGFINYQVKDIYDNARALLGPTFGSQFSSCFKIYSNSISPL
jgi:NADPH oxidase